MNLEAVLTILAVLMLIKGLVGVFDGVRYLDYVRRHLAVRPEPWLPKVSVILPCKGLDFELEKNVEAVFRQVYPFFEVVLVTATEIDPALQPLKWLAAKFPGHRIRFITAGISPDRGEKVHNLIQALAHVDSASEVFVFTDSDSRPHLSWLQELVAPLRDKRLGVSTGYRWYYPTHGNLASVVRSVWNGSIATLLGNHNHNFAWGGSMAIRRDVFFDIGVPEYWRGAVSDDYMLSSAVRDAGLHIVFAPGAMVASTDHINMRSFLSWARRQMVITRVYHPGLWWPAVAAHIVYCGGMAAAIAASVMGNRLAEWTLIAQLSPGMLKGANRATLAKAELPEYKTWFDRHGWVHTWFVPLATWVWLIALAGSAFTDAIEWRGRRYVLKPLPDGRGSLTDPTAASVRPPTEPRP